MGILDTELKKKNERQKTQEVKSERKEYKPRTATILVGKNNKQEPIPSYWRLR